MAEQASTLPCRTDFLAWPVNIRIQVYKHLFNQDSPPPSPFSMTIDGTPEDDGSIAYTTRTTTPVSISILQTCSKIHDEALPELYARGIYFPASYDLEHSLTMTSNGVHLRNSITHLDINYVPERGLVSFMATLLCMPSLRLLSFRLVEEHATTTIKIDEKGAVDVFRSLPPLPVASYADAPTWVLAALLGPRVASFVEASRDHLTEVAVSEDAMDEDLRTRRAAVYSESEQEMKYWTLRRKHGGV